MKVTSTYCYFPYSKTPHHPRLFYFFVNSVGAYEHRLLIGIHMETELFMAWPLVCPGLCIPYLLRPGIVFQFDTIKSVGGFSLRAASYTRLSMWAGSTGPYWSWIDSPTLRHWLFMAAILITIMATIQLGSGVQSTKVHMVCYQVSMKKITRPALT